MRAEARIVDRDDSLDLITVKEVAMLIKASAKTVYQWAELKQIPCYKINGLLRFDRSEVIDWIMKFKEGPTVGYNSGTQAGGPRKGGKGRYGALS